MPHRLCEPCQTAFQPSPHLTQVLRPIVVPGVARVCSSHPQHSPPGRHICGCDHFHCVQFQPDWHPVLSDPPLPVLQLVREPFGLRSLRHACSLQSGLQTAPLLCRYFHTMPYLLLRAPWPKWQAIGVLLVNEACVAICVAGPVERTNALQSACSSYGTCSHQQRSRPLASSWPTSLSQLLFSSTPCHPPATLEDSGDLFYMRARIPTQTSGSTTTLWWHKPSVRGNVLLAFNHVLVLSMAGKRAACTFMVRSAAVILLGKAVRAPWLHACQHSFSLSMDQASLRWRRGQAGRVCCHAPMPAF